MRSATLRTVGGSTVVAIPPAILEQLGLTPQSKVSIRVENGRLILQPKARPRYSLEELMAQCDLTKRPSKAEREWLDAPRSGKEEI